MRIKENLTEINFDYHENNILGYYNKMENIYYLYSNIYADIAHQLYPEAHIQLSIINE